MEPADALVTIAAPRDEAFLRTRTQPFIFKSSGRLAVGTEELTAKEVTTLIARMRKIMRAANGIGLSANQIGLPRQLFVASVPTAQGEPKFYAVFNPVIEKYAGDSVPLEEGCLSIPNTYGDVPRSRSVVLKGYDKHGKPLKIKAWDLLARVFQHEVDHLNGKLLIDRTKTIRRMHTG